MNNNDFPKLSLGNVSYLENFNLLLQIVKVLEGKSYCSCFFIVKVESFTRMKSLCTVSTVQSSFLLYDLPRAGRKMTC